MAHVAVRKVAYLSQKNTSSVASLLLPTAVPNNHSNCGLAMAEDVDTELCAHAESGDSTPYCNSIAPFPHAILCTQYPTVSVEQ